MRIGLSFDLRETIALTEGNLPEDAFEEYDYPATVDFIAAALSKGGNEIVWLGGGKEFLTKVLQERVDIVFNIAEGRGTYRSREAQVPAVLEMLDIPYTGSDPLCLSICLDKPLTKKLVSLAGIATPPWYVIRDDDELSSFSWVDVSFPAIVKPAFEGSSKGVRLNSVVYDAAQARRVIGDILDNYYQPVMLEGFIDGDEVTVGMLGNAPPQIVGIMRVLPRQKNGLFVYSLEVKRDWRALVDYECPAALPAEVMDKIATTSRRVFDELECRDFARIDFRIGTDGTPYFIEINPLPGLGDYSDLVIMALKMGWTHDGLLRAVLDAGAERYKLCVRR